FGGGTGSDFGRGRASVNKSAPRALYPHDHHFGALDQRRGLVAAFQAHLPRGVGGNDGSDVLAADGEPDLRQQALDAHLDDAAHQLIAPADGAEVGAALGRLFAQRAEEKAVDLAERNAMVAAGGLYRAQLALVDPLLQAGVADAQGHSGVART